MLIESAEQLAASATREDLKVLAKQAAGSSDSLRLALFGIIDGTLNLTDDRVKRSRAGALNVGASDSGDRDAIDFYVTEAGAEKLLWALSVGTQDAGGLDLRESDTAKTRLFIQRETGNVGIGSRVPGHRLHVEGTLKVTGEATLASALTVQGLVTASAGITVPTGMALTVDGDLKANAVTAGGTISAKAGLTVDRELTATGTLRFGETTRQTIDLWKAEYGIGVQPSTAYFRTAANFGFYRGGQHADAPLDPGGGAVVVAIAGDDVGVGTSAPRARLDVALGRRTDNHPNGLPLYVTGDIEEEARGVEFRHSNGTQGIGFGHNTIYATGGNETQDLNLRARGSGVVRIKGDLTVARWLYLTNPTPIGGIDHFRIGYETGNDTVVFYHSNRQGQYMRDDGVWHQNSDASMKENVADLHGILARVTELRPVSFDWRSTGTSGIGFIAQEVERVFPEIVSEHAPRAGETLKGLPYATFSVLAIAAIQDLKKEHDARIQELEARIAELSRGS